MSVIVTKVQSNGFGITTYDLSICLNTSTIANINLMKLSEKEFNELCALLEGDKEGECSFPQNETFIKIVKQTKHVNVEVYTLEYANKTSLPLWIFEKGIDEMKCRTGRQK